MSKEKESKNTTSSNDKQVSQNGSGDSSENHSPENKKQTAGDDSLENSSKSEEKPEGSAVPESKGTAEYTGDREGIMAGTTDNSGTDEEIDKASEDRMDAMAGTSGKSSPPVTPIEEQKPSESDMGTETSDSEEPSGHDTVTSQKAPDIEEKEKVAAETDAKTPGPSDSNITEAGGDDEDKPSATSEEETPNRSSKEEKPVAVVPAGDDEPDIPAGRSGEKKEELGSEDDLQEKDEEDHHDDDEETDYSEMSREELVEVIKELAKSEQVIKAERTAKEVKHAYDELREKEREEALKKFVAEGGEAADFSFRPDELSLRFDANFQLIRDRKQHFVKNKEQQKESNLKKKEDILERLRHFVDSEETNISFETFKGLQEEWKQVGPVPGAIARTLWANYNALVDRFYDKRSIYYELKELDRRKNLEAKIELCERAEKLAAVENINDAIKELNDLHHEFKHIGPVPQEEQEPLWQRFKAASDAVYERRKVFVEKLKGELEENLQVKLDLAEKVREFAEFDSDRIKEWNEKTRELLDIQKKWENTGGLPRARAKEVNRTFWSSFKQFFSNKNQFFKKLDAEREENLVKKREMVERAKKLQESDDWQSTAEALKALQREWKDVGPVPGKYRESIYKEFKAACDTFFDRKRSNQDDASKDYAENYKRKMEICDEIEKLAKGDKNYLDAFRKLQEEYNETGFVPRNKISETRNRYSDVVNKFVKALDGLTDEEKQRIKIENQVSDILHSPNADQKLYRKEQSLRKQISSIENDIALWKNNLEFFAESKKADKLKDEFQSKIESAHDELKQLKQQLRIIRTA